jgi:hypothetical protein
VQGALVLGVVVQWALYLVASLMLVTLWQVLSAPTKGPFAGHLEAVWSRYAPVFCAFLLLLPYAIWDAVKTSHRFVGPIYRLRRTLNQLASGEPVETLKFRDKDQWRHLAEEFNAALTKIGRITKNKDT